MTNILILGAHGQIALVATDLFLKHTDARLTLYLRNARRLKLSGHADRVRIVDHDEPAVSHVRHEVTVARRHVDRVTFLHTDRLEFFNDIGL